VLIRRLEVNSVSSFNIKSKDKSFFSSACDYICVTSFCELKKRRRTKYIVVVIIEASYGTAFLEIRLWM
jgi:hypothetical protein